LQAIDQALAIADAEGSEYLGERSARDLPDNYRPATSEDLPEAEDRQVNLDPPAYMRASARRGLEWHREGLSGDGLVWAREI